VGIERELASVKSEKADKTDVEALRLKDTANEREIASVRAQAEAQRAAYGMQIAQINLTLQTKAKRLEAENQALKARLDQQDRELKAIKQKLGL
jgi:hypothetical protein